MCVTNKTIRSKKRYKIETEEKRISIHLMEFIESNYLCCECDGTEKSTQKQQKMD